MKKQNIYLIILSFSLILFACQKEIAFNKKLIQPKLVINGFIEADSIIDVKVATSKTIPGVEKPFTWLDDATVKLYVDGVETETLTVYPIEYPETNQLDDYYNGNDSRPTVGYHTINTKAEAGKNYRIEVSHPDYETATAETYIPNKVEILSYASDETTEDDNGFYNSFQNFTIKIKDPEREKNYYRLTIRLFSGTQMQGGKDFTDTTDYISVSNQEVSYIESDDRVLNPDKEDANDFLFGSPYNTYNLFTDELIDGKEYNLQFRVGKSNYIEYSDNGFEIRPPNEGEFTWYIISLQSLTYDAFLYMKSSHAQNWYGNDFFSEPVQAFSNIENGVGIFAGYNASGIEVKNGEYPVDGVKYQYNNVPSILY